MAKTVLTVDDSASIRQMVSFTLKSAGYEVVEAVDGMDGLEKAKGKSFNLVLTDQNMPRMDGLTLIRTLRGLLLMHYNELNAINTEADPQTMRVVAQNVRDALKGVIGGQLGGHGAM